MRYLLLAAIATLACGPTFDPPLAPAAVPTATPSPAPALCPAGQVVFNPSRLDAVVCVRARPF